MTDRRERRREAGFTLVEALFATLLIAVILGMIATVTAQWLPNWNRGMARVERVELVAAGLERLVGDIAAAEFVSAGDANAPPLFDGAELSLTLVRTALGPNAGPGLEVVRIAELADDRGPSLVRMTAPFVPTAEDNRTGEQFAFANRVAVVRSPYRVSFAYAGLDGVWRATWRREAQLPHMVRISVRDAATARMLAVSTIALVRAELPARCVMATTPAECPALGAAPITAASSTGRSADTIPSIPTAR